MRFQAPVPESATVTTEHAYRYNEQSMVVEVNTEGCSIKDQFELGLVLVRLGEAVGREAYRREFPPKASHEAATA